VFGLADPKHGAPDGEDLVERFDTPVRHGLELRAGPGLVAAALELRASTDERRSQVRRDVDAAHSSTNCLV